MIQTLMNNRIPEDLLGDFFIADGDKMFENVERIERMSNEEYRQVLYYFQHPKEYEGDYEAFLEKVFDYSERVNHGELYRYQ